ncbi:AMP-binding protein [Microbispora catharanthi]|uniref:AMP-binding protein n=1 Tax=Microbispora catharanthi TaxID=1712871 RepID=A0A5N6C4M2_9ACTN|nr:AMP-binding protein [Microbispora catharanthi]
MTLNVASLFEAVAAAVPERLALVCDARRLRFAELDSRANALANHLRAAGVRPHADRRIQGARVDRRRGRRRALAQRQGRLPLGQVCAFHKHGPVNAYQEERWLRPSLRPSSSTRCAHRSASATAPCPGCTRPSCSAWCTGA